MKKIIFCCTVAFMAAISVFAENSYEVITDSSGYSYIQINEDLSEFRFNSDFKSIGNSGAVGYLVNGNAGQQTFTKKDGYVSATNLKAGDKLGFYLKRNNGTYVNEWKLTTFHNKTYIEFDKNSTRGNDEMMSFGEIVVISVGQNSATTGMPLPGFIPSFMAGVLVIMAVMGLKRKNIENNYAV